MDKHTYLMSIDMNYRTLYRQIQELEKKKDKTENEIIHLSALKEVQQEMQDDITLDD